MALHLEFYEALQIGRQGSASHWNSVGSAMCSAPRLSPSVGHGAASCQGSLQRLSPRFSPMTRTILLWRDLSPSSAMIGTAQGPHNLSLKLSPIMAKVYVLARALDKVLSYDEQCRLYGRAQPRGPGSLSYDSSPGGEGRA